MLVLMEVMFVIKQHDLVYVKAEEHGGITRLCFLAFQLQPVTGIQ